jgi:glycerophosphoryl diester phosphodiesterase
LAGLTVTVSSFSPELLLAVRRLLRPALGVRTALLGDAAVPLPTLLRRALTDGHDEAHPHVTAALAAPEGVTVASGLGLGVVPWTVNRRRDAQRLLRLGAAGVITDVPDAVRSACAAAAGRGRPAQRT